MKDLLKLLLEAQEKKKFTSQEDFKNFLSDIRRSNEYLELEWDDEAGEEWAILKYPHHGGGAMINSKIGLVFVWRSSNALILPDAFSQCVVYETENFDMDEWHIDLVKLEELVPEISWCVGEEAVNPERFSLQELFYATV